MEEKPNQRWLPWVCGALAALAWAAAHVAMHGPRGWPSWELGEWEVMLVVESLAAGQPVDLPVGAVHGHGLGSYMVALCVAPLRWLGLSPLLAAKVAATVLGAVTAGCCAAAAAAIGATASDSKVQVAKPCVATWRAWRNLLASLIWMMV